VKDLGWHDFRRTVAGELLNVGEDISTVAQILGHADVRTTARYDRRPAEARRKAARKISVPYFGR
jgi:integrase